MRLIDTETLQIKSFTSDIPKYAILSHTWGNDEDEVELQDMAAVDQAARKKGFSKIAQTCRIARSRDNLQYAWVDTCCIDKTSSAELTEAINSMFHWYEKAVICYAFLSDLRPEPHQTDKEAFSKSRWFTRGWTLQELIAPQNIEFFDQEWIPRGTKKSLCKLLSDITNIDTGILDKTAALGSVPVGRRMSWASARKTTRIEDMAYCLLGIFDVSMPLLYGERTKAFYRLQEEIIKLTNDLTLFAWQSHGPEGFQSIMAPSPAEFQICSQLRSTSILPADFSVTNAGLQFPGIIRMGSRHWPPSGQCSADNSFYLLPIRCTFDNDYNYPICGTSLPLGMDGRYVSELQVSNTNAQLDSKKHGKVLCIQLQYFGYDRFVRSSSLVYVLGDFDLYSMNFKERVYIAARISDHLLDEIGRSTARAIRFCLPQDICSTGAHPKSHWCILTKTFFTYGPARFWARATFGGVEGVGEITIVCGILHSLPTDSGSQYWFAIYLEHDKEADMYYHRDMKYVIPRHGPYTIQPPGSGKRIEVSGKESVIKQGGVSSLGFLITVKVQDTGVPVPSVPLVSSLSEKVRSKLRYLSLK